MTASSQPYSPALPEHAATDRPVAIWLSGVAVMVFLMIVIGGITRLTESGLSMAEWRPFIGWIPPLSEKEWYRVFSIYQDTPEFQKVNSWMTIEDFKEIFFWEYLHRVWGRLIGIAFALPFLVLALTGKIRRALYPRLGFLFLLGALQGVIGWWMVKSGLVDNPAVSQYRLAIHLSVAFIILGALIWTVLQLQRISDEPDRRLRRHAMAALHLIALTVVAGAFVAGLDAGLIYNTFPLMDGHIVPPDYAYAEPFWINIFENPATVQFHHRVVAIVTYAVIVWLLVRAIRSETIRPRTRLSVHTLAGMASIQVALGISTLLAQVPVSLGAAHQGGAALTFAAAFWVLFETSGARTRSS
ncbi:COX15/CtaA family protein [Nisaea acidiphila]|uniref:Heme A synthase n=1 Tax=Nisaea acidiphila TaxID=1862145 RepID=A0A9J7AYZ6_9PROT|nr:COX15/CtaA family protein [Nisaea acidiphila]UUX51657.1 COX15/CtaA family protein [Nisaea acidiphila]